MHQSCARAQAYPSPSCPPAPTPAAPTARPGLTPSLQCPGRGTPQLEASGPGLLLAGCPWTHSHSTGSSENNSLSRTILSILSILLAQHSYCQRWSGLLWWQRSALPHKMFHDLLPKGLKKYSLQRRELCLSFVIMNVIYITSRPDPDLAMNV